MSKTAFRRTVLLFVAALTVLSAVLIVRQYYATRRPRVVLIAQIGDAEYEFWDFVKQGAREGAREFNVDLSITGPQTEADVEGQIHLVRHAIHERPDAIILAPVDQIQLREVANEVDDAGIPLILVDTKLDESEGFDSPDKCFVGINNTKAASELAREMANAMGRRGQVAILTPQQNSSTQTDRVAGFRSALEAYPDIDLVEVAVCGNSASVAYEQTKRLLRQYPALRGLLGSNPECSEGALRALRERSTEEEHVYFYAFDTSSAQNADLEEGIVDGFVAQLAFNLGYLGVEAASQASENRLRTGTMDSGYVYADRENMRDETIQKLIYPFVSS